MRDFNMVYRIYRAIKTELDLSNVSPEISHQIAVNVSGVIGRDEDRKRVISELSSLGSACITAIEELKKLG
jgi:hypothetical protein